MKTSLKISAIALSLTALFTLNVKAQDNRDTEPTTTTNSSRIKLSVGPDLALPVGGLSNAYSVGFGGSVQADFPVVKDQLFVTVNAGYLNFFKDKSNVGNDLQLIPVKAGLKYFPVKNFYLQGEAGASFLANKSDIGATNSASFVYAPQIGYQFGLGGSNYLDAGVRFEGNSKFTDLGKSNNFFGLRVAYSFGL